jgi:hypothetical protein
MIFLRKRALIFSLLLVIISSCNTRPSRTITEMEFVVDSSLVTRPESDSSLGITYSVPGNWQAVEGSKEALSQVQADNIRISNMLKNRAGTVVFSLTDVRQVADSVFRKIDENYQSLLNPSGTWSSVDRAEFVTKGFQVKQYMMARQGQTIFKMVFADRQRPLFQVDYSIMVDSAYASNTKTLESIIGSLKHDH